MVYTWAKTYSYASDFASIFVSAMLDIVGLRLYSLRFRGHLFVNPVCAMDQVTLDLAVFQCLIRSTRYLWRQFNLG
jgi:hypothetical protein